VVSPSCQPAAVGDREGCDVNPVGCLLLMSDVNRAWACPAIPLPTCPPAHLPTHPLLLRCPDCNPRAVKQEIDRNEDMLRSCLRAIDALAKLPNAQQASLCLWQSTGPEGRLLMACGGGPAGSPWRAEHEGRAWS